MEYDKAIKSGTLYQNKITDIGDKIRAAMLSAFGIVFFYAGRQWDIFGRYCHKSVFSGHLFFYDTQLQLNTSRSFCILLRS